MKKALKITGITLLSLIGLVVVAAGVAYAMITSSGQLTKIVNKYIPQYVDCETRLGKADLTLKTFPNLGVEINNVTLVNPMAGSPSDTLANIDRLILSADIKKILKNKDIEVEKCILENAYLNLYSDSTGKTNYDVFGKSDNDTTKSKFNYSVDLKQVTLKNSTVSYVNDGSSLAARMDGLDINLKGNMKNDNITADANLHTSSFDFKSGKLAINANKMGLSYNGDINGYSLIDGHLKLDSPDITLNYDENFLSNDTLTLDLPLHFNIDDMTASLDKAKIGLNDFAFDITGNGSYSDNGDIGMDITLNTNILAIENVIKQLPESITEALNGMNVTGKVKLSDCTVKGVFNDSEMPLIATNINGNDISIEMEELPYPLTDIDLNAVLSLDLLNQSKLTINNVKATMNKSQLTADGTLSDITNQMLMNLNIKADMPLSDIKAFMPDDVNINGQGNIKLKLTNTVLDDLLRSFDDFNFNRVNSSGTIVVDNFNVIYSDSIKAISPKLNIGLTTPASRKISGTKGICLTIDGNDLDVEVGNKVQTLVQNPDITLRADNFLDGYERMDAMADLKMSHIDFRLDTIKVVANTTHFVAETAKNNKNTKGLNLYTNIDNEEIAAALGKGYSLISDKLKLTATVEEDKNQPENNPLLHWNPTTDFVLSNAEMHIDGIDEKIAIPSIDFLINNNELALKSCSARLGKSDLNLEGNILGIADYINQTGELKGDLDLTSSYLDINEIMDLTSGIGVSEEEIAPANEPDDKEANPFIVPRGLDFTFTINSRKALYGNFDLNNLGGRLTVNKGKLILEEIGFTNEAAEMQLTAIYESPRRNHLFLGMDFHLLDVKINDLIRMIPEIDTLVPMLKTFDGKGEFHITAQTNLNAKYEPKISTLRAAADIEGQNLYVKDTTSFSKITNFLKVSTNGEYRVDSLDVQLTVFRNEIDLYPFLITIGKYKAVASGRHTLDMNCDYHISVTDTPIALRLGLDIKGPMNDLSYKLAPCKYKNLYRPERRKDTDNMVLELKKMISNSLKRTVK